MSPRIILCAALVACSSSGGNPGDAGADVSAPVDAAADAGWTFAPSTSVAELQQNDTSACGSGTAPCTKAWSQTQTVTYGSGSTYSGQKRTVKGFWNETVASGAQNPGSANGYVSKIPVSVLLPAQSVPVFVETQNWWGGGSGHIDNGEVSSDATQIANQITDQISRGFAGQIIDWYGQGTTADKAMPAIQKNAEASGGKYQFAVMIDKGLFNHCGETVTCLNDSIAYLVSTYTSSPAYLKDGSGHPLVFYFINSYYPTEYAILNDPGVDPKGTKFVMYEPNGFPPNEPPNTIGEYGWVNPSGATTSSSGAEGSFSWKTDFGFGNIKSFFDNASANPTSYAVSDVHKGFDDNLANWSLNRVIDQRCGQTWLQTFHHTGTFGGSASFEGSLDYLTSGGKLDFVMVDTWDDYEEGTEIETGIDNCLTSLAVTLSGTTLSWTPTWGADPMDSTAMGSEETLFEYSVYAAQQGATQLMHLADLPCSAGKCPNSFDLSTLGMLGGPYVFYVPAVGMPSIVNTLGGPTTATLSR